MEIFAGDGGMCLRNGGIVKKRRNRQNTDLATYIHKIAGFLAHEIESQYRTDVDCL